MTDQQLWTYVGRLTDVVSGKYRKGGKTLASGDFKKLIDDGIESIGLKGHDDPAEIEWIISEVTRKLGARGGRQTRNRNAGRMPIETPPSEPAPKIVIFECVERQFLLPLFS